MQTLTLRPRPRILTSPRDLQNYNRAAESRFNLFRELSLSLLFLDSIPQYHRTVFVASNFNTPSYSPLTQ